MPIPQEETTMPRRAYSYLRVSCLAQAHGDGLRRQDDFAAQICQEEGWCLDDTLSFVDRGRSAFHGDNARIGALSRFLAAVKSGRVAAGSVLIIECIDRLSREQVDEAYDLFLAILKSGVNRNPRAEARLPPRDHRQHDRPTGTPFHHGQGGRGEQNQERPPLRPLGGTAPPGPRRRPTHRPTLPGLDRVRRRRPLPFSPGPAATVRTIFRLCREGMGLGHIVDYLRGRPADHPPFGSSGVWTRSYLRLIIKGRSALGEWQPRVGRDGRNMKPADAPSSPSGRPSYPRTIGCSPRPQWPPARASAAGPDEARPTYSPAW